MIFSPLKAATAAAVLVLLLSAVSVSAQEHLPKKVLSKTHESSSSGHEALEAELGLLNKAKAEAEVGGFTCTITGASGQDQCDAAQDDDGSNCVWCVLNSFGFCVNEMQAEQFKQIMPTIDCDNDGVVDDDAPPTPDDDDSAGPLWQCLESKEQDDCPSDTCVWCDTKGGFGVCITPEAAQMAENSYWFDCKTEQTEEKGQEDPSTSSSEDQLWHEFTVDTSCVLAGLDLTHHETSEDACFHAKDSNGNPCEWCSVAGSDLQFCLSEPQAQVAEYVGALCSGSDDSFEPEDFDDTCVQLMTSTSTQDEEDFTRQDCWAHQDLDGNQCEFCTILGMELCLGGVQAELVEHWGATCVLDDTEHQMASHAIEQHKLYLKARKQELQLAQDDNELDLSTLWLTPDHSCMATTLTNSANTLHMHFHDKELACAETSDKHGKPCNWCRIGTMLDMCVNDEQADIAQAMGMECEVFSEQTRAVLREHAERVAAMDEDDEEDEEEGLAVSDFDPSCIMSMQMGPDEDTCTSTQDQDGQACQWCSWNNYHLCLAAEQAEMVEPFGVDCDATAVNKEQKDNVAKQTFSALAPPDMDTSCLMDTTTGQFHGDEATCEAAKDDTTGQPCQWCTVGSIGIHACMSAEQADMAKPLGVTCSSGADAEEEDAEETAVLKDLPNDFWSCLSQSQTVDDCDESCTWCDLKNVHSNNNANNLPITGLCLSDSIADAVIQMTGDNYLDCEESIYDQYEDEEGEEYDDEEEEYEGEEEEYEGEEEEEEEESEDSEDSEEEDNRRGNLGDLIADAMDGSIA